MLYEKKTDFCLRTIYIKQPNCWMLTLIKIIIRQYNGLMSKKKKETSNTEHLNMLIRILLKSSLKELFSWYKLKGINRGHKKGKVMVAQGQKFSKTSSNLKITCLIDPTLTKFQELIIT